MSVWYLSEETRWFSTTFLDIVRHTRVIFKFDTYCICTGKQNRLAEKEKMTEKEKKNSGHYKTYYFFLSIEYYHQWCNKQKKYFPWAVQLPMMTPCHYYTHLVEFLSSRFLLFLVLPQRCTILHGPRKPKKYPQAWDGGQIKEKQSNMFSIEVKFLPSVVSLPNQQCRSKMHRSYHRRNVHRYCTYWLFLKTWPIFFSHSYPLYKPLFFPFVPLQAVFFLLAATRVSSWPQCRWQAGDFFLYLSFFLEGGRVKMVLLDLTGCGGSSLAAHAGGVNCFRGDQIQVLIIRDLIEPVPIL